ncbi:hypothetical protein [Bifidobacterium castoris]|uniref:Uncharacterized protein n=1 Tax=Bifidobacterium castoris TaxID=2306972 RepID=A0A430F4E4_9BIFI|nr:hypothetical protein [Bifidobacterium castoris]RSX44665.1 hypothetical protein D2E22_1951 [Bifidobacterium castoris]
MTATSVDIPNTQMTRRQRFTAVASFRKHHAWAVDYEPHTLLDHNPGMSVREAFEQLKAEAEREQRLQQEKERRDVQRTAHRLYNTRYCALEEPERIQLRIFLENGGRKDIADALVDNVTCSAESIRKLIDEGEWDRDPEKDWLAILPPRAQPEPTVGGIGRFLADLRAHRRKWRMWGTFPTSEGAEHEARVLSQRAGLGFDIRTVTYQPDGTTGVFARRP